MHRMWDVQCSKPLAKCPLHWNVKGLVAQCNCELIVCYQKCVYQLYSRDLLPQVQSLDKQPFVIFNQHLLVVLTAEWLPSLHTFVLEANYFPCCFLFSSSFWNGGNKDMGVICVKFNVHNMSIAWSCTTCHYVSTVYQHVLQCANMHAQCIIQAQHTNMHAQHANMLAPFPGLPRFCSLVCV